jgi:hypothetical protein
MKQHRNYPGFEPRFPMSPHSLSSLTEDLAVFFPKFTLAMDNIFLSRPSFLYVYLVFVP